MTIVLDTISSHQSFPKDRLTIVKSNKSTGRPSFLIPRRIETCSWWSLLSIPATHLCSHNVVFTYFSRSAKTGLLLVQQYWQPRPLPRSPSWMKRTLCTLLTTHGAIGDTSHRLITELFDVVSKSTVRFALLVTPCSTFDSVSLSELPTRRKR